MSVDVIKVASSTYHFLDSVRWLEVRVYPPLRDSSQRIGARPLREIAMAIGDALGVHLRTLITRVYPGGV